MVVVLGLFSLPKSNVYVYTGAYPECEETAVIPVPRGDDVKISFRISDFFGGDKKESGELVIVGGGVFGAQVKTNSVSVVECKNQKELKAGDVIVKIADCSIHGISDIEKAVRESSGETIIASVKRDGKLHTVKLTPYESDGEYKLGIRLKDTAAGIGTITYIDPATGEFGGLGHGICDPDSGDVIPIRAGEVRDVVLGGVEKGEAGKPGELSGILTEKTLGVVQSNTECGLFGRLDTLPDTDGGMLVEVASRSEVKCGVAYIYSTVKNGKMGKFDIEITEVDSSSHGTKSFKIKVTDPALIAITGGIVRGMSGSPIIQNGKLVGAVTHVMVADPTEGYGIFIENMLEAAQQGVQPKAA